jgi:transposase
MHKDIIIKEQAELINVQAELIEQLQSQIVAIESKVVAFESKIALLKKNSGNSSKPPSSDIVKPPKSPHSSMTNTKPKIGVQKGHEQHTRPLFPPEQVDRIIALKLETCPTCGGKLNLSSAPPQVFQQAELVPKPYIVTEYHQQWYWCEHCQCYHCADVPDEVAKSVFFAPNLIALTAYLKSRCHMSYKTLQQFSVTCFRSMYQRDFW